MAKPTYIEEYDPKTGRNVLRNIKTNKLVPQFEIVEGQLYIADEDRDNEDFSINDYDRDVRYKPIKENSKKRMKEFDIAREEESIASALSRLLSELEFGPVNDERVYNKLNFGPVNDPNLYKK